MEAQAIKMITDAAVAAANVTPQTDTPSMVLPDSFSLKSLESMMGSRSRFRGEYKTNSTEDFAAYAAARKSTDSKCFIDQESMRAQLIINMGDDAKPGHCDDVAYLTLIKTAAYKALLGIDGKRNTQAEIADFLEDWRDYLDPIDADEKSLQLPKTLQAIRSIDIKATSARNHTETNLSAETKGFDKIEAESQHQLPYGFKFTCKPYSPLTGRHFVLRLAVLTGGEKPALILRIMKLEATKEEIANEFKTLLLARMDSLGLKAFIGSFTS